MQAEKLLSASMRLSASVSHAASTIKLHFTCENDECLDKHFQDGFLKISFHIDLPKQLEECCSSSLSCFRLSWLKLQLTSCENSVLSKHFSSD